MNDRSLSLSLLNNFGQSHYTPRNNSLETVIAMTLVIRDAVELHVVRYVAECRGWITAVVVAADALLGHFGDPPRRRRRCNLHL